MTSHCITWHDTTQAITSHQMTWPSHDLTPQQTSRHQNTSLQSTKHHHHGTAEGSFTAKEWFGHRAGRSPCAHSIGKFFLCYIVLFLLETSAPGLSGHYWYTCSIHRRQYFNSRPTQKKQCHRKIVADCTTVGEVVLRFVTEVSSLKTSLDKGGMGWGVLLPEGLRGQKILLGCPMKIGSRVSKWVITPIFPIYE